MACEGHMTCDSTPMSFSFKALNKEGFMRIMKGVLKNMTEEMLEVLFLKVDSDCNGFVTWVRRVSCCHRRLGEARRSILDVSAEQSETWRWEAANIRKSIWPLVPVGVLAR